MFDSNRVRQPALGRCLALFRGDRSGPWIIVAAILTLAVALAAIGVLYSEVYESVYHDYAASKDEAARKDEFERRCSGIASVEGLRSCFNDYIATGWETQRAQEDLYAQKQMAEWAFWVLVVTGTIGVVSVGLTGFGVWQVVLNLREARRAADAAQQTIDFMQKSERPHITAVKMVSDTIERAIEEVRRRGSSTGRKGITLEVDFVNVGTRAAIPLALHAGYCFVDSLKRDPDIPPQGGIPANLVLIPNADPETMYANFIMPAKIVHDFAEYVQPICFLGFLRYRDIHGNHWRSWFAFVYHPKQGDDDKSRRFFEVGHRDVWGDEEEESDPKGPKNI